jgi:hypothetical protein
VGFQFARRGAERPAAPTFQFSLSPLRRSFPTSFPSFHQHPHSIIATTTLNHRIAGSLCFPKQDDDPELNLATGHLNSNLTVAFFHDHITNEQIHVAESSRHTLNPTGARASEEEKSEGGTQAISTIVLRGPTSLPSAAVIGAVAVDTTATHRSSSPAEVQRARQSARCLAQALPSCRHRQHQHPHPGRPHSCRRGNTSANSVTELLAEASTAADMSDLVRILLPTSPLLFTLHASRFAIAAPPRPPRAFLSPR